MQRTSIAVLVGTVVFFSVPAEAAFTKLFKRIDFKETCAFIADSPSPGGMPGGTPCKGFKERSLEEFPISEDENVLVAGSSIFSGFGSTLSVRQLPDHDLGILVNGKEVLRFTDPGGVADPISAGYWQGSSWIVEYLGKFVVVDGKQIGTAEGYDRVFFYRQIGRRPFFFFEQAGKIGVSYFGKDQEARYDQVAHRLCCEPSKYNVRHNNDSVSFYGRRGSTWYLVEARSTSEPLKK